MKKYCSAASSIEEAYMRFCDEKFKGEPNREGVLKREADDEDSGKEDGG